MTLGTHLVQLTKAMAGTEMTDRQQASKAIQDVIDPECQDALVELHRWLCAIEDRMNETTKEPRDES